MHTLSVYILKRLLHSIPLILFVMAINFLIIHAAPGDPITYLYGSSAEVSPEQMNTLREELGLIVLAFNLMGDGLNDALNPRSREK